MRATAICALFAAASWRSAVSLSCKDESGNDVGWWSMIKLPGTGQYFYADGAKEEYVQSSYSVQGNGGALINTLSSSFQHSYVLYNDETPDDKQSSVDGHTKGVVALDDNLDGFWLVHSVPKFPSQVGGVLQPYPDSGITYGQSFLCLSLQSTAFETVADALYHNRPQIYNVSLSSTVQAQLPYLTNVCLNKEYDSEATYGQGKLTTTDAREFTVFSKTAKWGQDLYNSLVSAYYGADTYSETWMNGVNPLPNFCPPDYTYGTYNIEHYNLGGFTIGNTKDHSKLALVNNGNHLCIGGINRMESQEARGGGTVCFETPALNAQLSASMSIYGYDSPKGGCQPSS